MNKNFGAAKLRATTKLILWRGASLPFGFRAASFDRSAGQKKDCFMFARRAWLPVQWILIVFGWSALAWFGRNRVECPAGSLVGVRSWEFRSASTSISRSAKFVAALLVTSSVVKLKYF